MLLKAMLSLEFQIYLYPCGEGAGYAGGILSAAADGMRCAEQICRFIQEEVSL